MNKALFRFAVLLTILSSVFGICQAEPEAPAVATAVTTATSPVEAVATQPASAPADLSKAIALRDEGIKKALAGEFEAALKELKQASTLDPEDKATLKTIKLLDNYLARREKIESERASEYQYEIDRIKWADLAQAFHPEFESKPYAQTLRKMVRTELADAYHDIGTSDQYEECTAEEAVKMKEFSLASIKKTGDITKKIVDLFKGNGGEFAKEFRAEAKTLQERLDACKAIWEASKTETPKDRWETACQLREVESQLSDAMADVEVMIIKSPWKIGLLHARIAKEIAPDKEKLRNSEWYQQLLKDTEERGRKYIEEAKWYDALSAFMGLEELEPENKSFKEEVERVRTHVRARRLYGKESNDEEDDEEDESATLTEDEKEAQEEAQKEAEGLWKEMVAGVDAQMVRKAISKVGTSYVKAPDYRELTKGALESVKVLVQTPQVAETFPGLKDKEKLKEFVATIDKELETVQKKDRVDHLDLQTALNNLNYSSEETVDIPLEVISVEFASGFLGKLDKFSNMIWPYDVESFNKSTMGKFTGIGIQITKEAGKPLKVVTPMLGTPAYKAKIKAGDLILEVDGVNTKKLSVDKLVKRIMGPPNSKVELTIKRRGVAEPFKVVVTREDVHIRTVKGWQRDKTGEWDFILQNGGGKVGYIRLTQFTDTTHSDLAKALKKMRADGVTSLVLDLRSNPGGLLRSATAVADEFIDDVQRIVFTRGRQVPRNEINSTPKGIFQDGNLVVLVDQHSASAAEILSGALKDYKRAIIVGQRSYGKGSVQNVIPVRSEEAFLKLTTAYYYLPSGRLLHREDDSTDWGVNPDIDVYVTPKQMRRWMQLRRKTDLLQEVVPEILAADLADQYKADLQLNTAVLILQLMDIEKSKSISQDGVAAGS